MDDKKHLLSRIDEARRELLAMKRYVNSDKFNDDSQYMWLGFGDDFDSLSRTLAAVSDDMYLTANDRKHRARGKS